MRIRILRSFDGSRLNCREHSKNAARNPDIALMTRRCDGPCMPDRRVKVFAALRNIPLLVAIGTPGLLTHHEMVARTEDRTPEHSDGRKGSFRNGEGPGTDSCVAAAGAMVHT
jgi:hypothetical protein